MDRQTLVRAFKNVKYVHHRCVQNVIRDGLAPHRKTKFHDVESESSESVLHPVHKRLVGHAPIYLLGVISQQRFRPSTTHRAAVSPVLHHAIVRTLHAFLFELRVPERVKRDLHLHSRFQRYPHPLPIEFWVSRIRISRQIRHEDVLMSAGHAAAGRVFYNLAVKVTDRGCVKYRSKIPDIARRVS